MSTQPPAKTVQDDVQEVRNQLARTQDELAKTRRGVRLLWTCLAALLLLTLSNLPNLLPWRQHARFDTLNTRELVLEGMDDIPAPGTLGSFTRQPNGQNTVFIYSRGEPIISDSHKVVKIRRIVASD